MNCWPTELNDLTDPINFIFHPDLKEKIFSDEIYNFLQELKRAAPQQIAISNADRNDLFVRPAFTLAYKDQQNLHYMAIPQKKEIEPFQKALLGLVSTKKTINKINKEAQLTLFISNDCSNCPNVVFRTIQLAINNPLIDLSIVDIHNFPQLVKQYSISSVPQLLIDKELSIVGLDITEEQIIKKIIKKSEYQIFLSLIEQGRMVEAILKLSSPGANGQTIFLKSWESSNLSSRMALMLLIEQILEEDKTSLKGLAVQLISCLSSTDPSLRGDTADLLGKLGEKEVIKALSKLLNDSNQDVQEIAAEAIDCLTSC